MNKKFVSIILVIVISFTAFISAPVSVYASVGGYSWEDYYDLDSSGNYTFNDAFYDLSTKAKVYVILDTLQNADDKVTAEYIAEDDSAINALSYIAWVILSANGIVSDFVSDTGVATSIVSVFVDLFDSGEITARSGGGFTVSSSAVNTIRETYVDDYRLDIIDEYNAFCYGSFYAYDDFEFSDDNESLSTNLDMYSLFWGCDDYWTDTQKSNMLFVPEIMDEEYALSYDEGYDYFNTYKPYFLQVYVPTDSASSGSWHITQLCKSYNNGSTSQCGKLYYDGGDVTSDLLLNRSGTTSTGNNTFSFSSSYEGATLPYSALCSQMFYDYGHIFADTTCLYWYYGSSVSSSNSTLTYFAASTYKDYFSYSVKNSDGTYTQNFKGICADTANSSNIRYSSYYSGSLSSNTRLVMLSADADLVNDVDGTSHNYNTPSNKKVSDNALNDAQDGDETNSPSISIPNESITYAIDNYDNIIEAVEEDDSTDNVASLLR